MPAGENVKKGKQGFQKTVKKPMIPTIGEQRYSLRTGLPIEGETRELTSAEAPMMTGLSEIPTSAERRAAVDAILDKIK